MVKVHTLDNTAFQTLEKVNQIPFYNNLLYIHHRYFSTYDKNSIRGNSGLLLLLVTEVRWKGL